MSRYLSNAGDGRLGQFIVWGVIALIFLLLTHITSHSMQ